MSDLVTRAALAAALLMPCATAQAVTLKVSFFSSDRSATYQAVVKPFVEAVTAASEGQIKFDIQSSGAIEREVGKQPQLVREGRADIAFIVPGTTADAFPDDAILEMPGLYRDSREASLVFTRLVAANALRGYEDFHVIGAFIPKESLLHARGRSCGVAELKGKKVRASNPVQAAAIASLGAVPVAAPINKVSLEMSAGEIEAAVLPTGALFDFGVQRIATCHFLLGIGGAPIALVMSRAKYEALPGNARELIRRYSGDWAVQRFAELEAQVERKVIDTLKADGQRSVVTPTAAEQETARAAFRGVFEAWRAKDPGHETLARMASRAITALRRD